jgi:hypothetical protein
MPRHPAHHLRSLALAAACGLLVVAGGAGCARRPSPPGGAQSPKAEHARKQLEVAALDAVKSAAAAADRANPAAARVNQNPGLIGKAVAGAGGATVAVSTPAPAAPTTPSATAAPAVRGNRAPSRPAVAPVFSDRVKNPVPRPTEAEAERDALAQAAERIELTLKEQDPPVRYRPSVDEVKAEFARRVPGFRKPTQAEKDLLPGTGISEDGVYVEYDVVVMPDQVRTLRSHERVLTGFRVAAGLAVVALAGFLFLRIDEWTKGYLTSWLALGAFGLAGGAAALLVFV